MRNKYHARKIVRNGETFDSEREYRRYVELTLLQKAGKIQGLQRQVPFELIPAQYEEVKGKKPKCIERAVKYVADFIYLERGQVVVEDVKGYRTKEYVLKRKMMLYFHGIRIREV